LADEADAAVGETLGEEADEVGDDNNGVGDGAGDSADDGAGDDAGGGADEAGSTRGDEGLEKFYGCTFPEFACKESVSGGYATLAQCEAMYVYIVI
jgi:hypothetical protein